MDDAKKLLLELVDKLESRRKWETVGYYSTELETAAIRAKQDILDGLIEDIKEICL